MNFLNNVFARIKAFFVKVEHDVETIVADFQRTIDKLDDYAVKKWNEVDEQFHVRDTADAAAKVAADAAARAEKIASNVKALVS